MLDAEERAFQARQEALAYAENQASEQRNTLWSNVEEERERCVCISDPGHFLPWWLARVGIEDGALPHGNTRQPLKWSFEGCLLLTVSPAGPVKWKGMSASATLKHSNEQLIALPPSA